MINADKYLQAFASLNTAIVKGKKAPHNAVLLLSIADLISSGVISENHIVLTEELVSAYQNVWEDRVTPDMPFQAKVATPYWHMQNEPFYTLFFNDGTIVTPISNPYSVTKLRQIVYAKLDDDLFELLRDESFKDEMNAVLSLNYLEE